MMEAVQAGKCLYGPGGRSYRSLPVGARFRFPKSDQVMRKEPRGYRDPQGRKFVTGPHTYVFRVSDES